MQMVNGKLQLMQGDEVGVMLPDNKYFKGKYYCMTVDNEYVIIDDDGNKRIIGNFVNLILK